jgi:hypothetical protein
MIYDIQQQNIDALYEQGYYITDTFFAGCHPDQEIPAMAHKDRDKVIAVMPDGTTCAYNWVE